MITSPQPHIGYVRVSTAKQGASGLGLQAQEQAIREYVTRQPSASLVLPLYVEVESGKRVDRVELKKALNKCRLMGATLVVAKLDRLSRNAQFLMSLVDSGVDVVFCDLPNVPPGPVGRFLLQQMAAVAELERGLISERTKAALQAAKARGRQLGGYRGGAKVDPAMGLEARRKAAEGFRARVLPAINEIRANGLTSANAIARELTQRGIKTARQSGQWSPAQVLRVLAG